MPEMRYDTEFAVTDLVAMFKANLNTEIGNINTEKGSVSGDALFIEDIATDDDHFIFGTLTKKTLNIKGFFVMYGVSAIGSEEANTQNFEKGNVITFEVSTFDNGEQNLNDKFFKLLRYQRALEAVLEKNPDVFRGYGKPLVESLKPAAFPYSRNVVILSTGVDITASLTSN